MLGRETANCEQGRRGPAPARRRSRCGPTAALLPPERRGGTASSLTTPVGFRRNNQGEKTDTKRKLNREDPTSWHLSGPRGSGGWARARGSGRAEPGNRLVSWPPSSLHTRKDARHTHQDCEEGRKQPAPSRMPRNEFPLRPRAGLSPTARTVPTRPTVPLTSVRVKTPFTAVAGTSQTSISTCTDKRKDEYSPGGMFSAMKTNQTYRHGLQGHKGTHIARSPHMKYPERAHL